jgi:translation initiation factor 4G
MDAYAARIHGLSKNQTISSRHRFMCQDVLEMRQKGWRERRKQEGPKKIGDVHKDAQREASNQARGGGGRGGGRDERGPPRGGDRGGGDRGGRDFGGPGGRDGFRGGDRDSRGGGRDRDGGRGGRDRDGRGSPANDAPPRAMRGGVADAGGRLAPRSDLGRGGDRGGRDAPPRPVPGPRGEKGGSEKEAKEKAPEPASAAPAAAPPMSEEEYETERKRVLEYFFDDKDADEAIAAISRWGGFEPRVPEFVQHLVVSGFERRTMDWDAAASLFRMLPRSAGGPAPEAGLVAGVKLVLDDLEDHKCDLPKADTHLATVLAGVVADGSVAFKEIAAAAHEAGPEGETGYLREEGGAAPVLCKILAAVADACGAPRAERVLADSGVDLAAFIGDMDKEDGVTLDAMLEKYGIGTLPAAAALHPLRAKLAELNEVSADSSAALASWIEGEAAASARVSTEFVGEVAAWALAAVPADADTSSPIAALEPSFAALRAACKGPDAGSPSKSEIGKEAREIAVLSAAQRLCASRSFPAGLLERIFRDLHAGDVLDETAMKAWRDDESSAIGLEKIAGKEKALFETMELLQEFASDDEGAEDAA